MAQYILNNYTDMIVIYFLIPMGKCIHCISPIPSLGELGSQPQGSAREPAARAVPLPCLRAVPLPCLRAGQAGLICLFCGVGGNRRTLK